MPRPAWISTGTRRSCASATISRTAGSDSVKRSARGCSLIPLAPASRQRRASVSGSSRGSSRQNATSRPPESAAASMHAVVGGRVAVRARASGRRRRAPPARSSAASSSLGRLAGAVGIGVADVGVGVEQRRRRRGRRACGPTRGAGSRRRRAWAEDPIQTATRMADTGPACISAASASGSRPQRHEIEGTLQLPNEGFRSRTTDFLNAHEREFLRAHRRRGPLAGRQPRRSSSTSSSPSPRARSCWCSSSRRSAWSTRADRRP